MAYDIVNGNIIGRTIESWVASLTKFTPTSKITSTNVQDAIVEVEASKLDASNILTTDEELEAVTETGSLVDATLVKEINTNLTNLPTIKTYPCVFPAKEQTFDSNTSRVLINGVYGYPDGFNQSNCMVLCATFLNGTYYQMAQDVGRAEFAMSTDDIRCYVNNSVIANASGFITLCER